MGLQRERRLAVVAAILTAITLAVAIGAVVYVRGRSVAILNRLASTDPSPARQALLRRLEADRLVREALRDHEAATTGTAATQPAGGGAVAPQIVPLLEKAERSYLASLDAASSQPALLFELGEVNLLMGRRARAYLYLARYWEAMGEKELGQTYTRLAHDAEASATISLRGEAATSLGTKGTTARPGAATKRTTDNGQ